MHRLFPLVAFCLLAGCTTYHAQPLVPVDLAHKFERRSLVDAGLHAFVVSSVGHEVTPWPPAHWNRELLTLAAWYYSPSLDVARAQSETARAHVDVAGAVPNPTLQLPFEYATPNPGPGAPITAGISLDIPIETAGKRGFRTDQATHLAEAAQFDLDTQAWKVSAQVRDALIALCAAQARRAALARSTAAEQAVVAMMQKRHQAGENSSSDVALAALTLNQTQREYTASRTALDDARAQLAAAIGMPVSAIDGIDIDTSSLYAPPLAPPDAEAQREAIFHRSDLLASLADYAAAESALQLEVAKQYPDIHLGPGYTYDTGTRRVAFGLAGVTLPIFDQNQGGIREAESKRKEAAARAAALQDTILGELDHALARYRSSLAALRLADDRLKLARKQLNDRRGAFSSGEIDRLEYTKATSDYETSDIGRLDALVAAQQAAAAVEDAIQRPLRRHPRDTDDADAASAHRQGEQQ